MPPACRRWTTRMLPVSSTSVPSRYRNSRTLSFRMKGRSIGCGQPPIGTEGFGGGGEGGQRYEAAERETTLAGAGTGQRNFVAACGFAERSRKRPGQASLGSVYC